MIALRHLLVAVILTVISIGYGHAQTPAGGTLDSTFATGGIRQFSLSNGSLKATDLAFASDGSMYVVGTKMTATTPQFSAYMIKLTPTGALDTAFNTTGSLSVPAGEPVHGRCVVVMPDGTLRVGCYSTTAFIVVALNANGSLLTTYGTNGIAKRTFFGTTTQLRGMLVQSDGKLILYGSTAHASGSALTGTTNARAVRLTTTGVVDSTYANVGFITEFTANESRHFLQFELLSGDRTKAVMHSGNGPTGRTYVLGYLATGARDTTYASGGVFSTATVSNPIGFFTDAAGATTIVGTNPPSNRIQLYRVNAAGTGQVRMFDSDGVALKSVGVTADAPVGVVGRAADERIFVGNTTSNGTTTDFNLLRLRSDGALDPTFDTDGSVTTPIGIGMDVCAGIKMQSDGKIVLFGSSQAAASPAHTGFALARYHPGPTETDTVPTIISQPVSVTVPVGSPASFTFGVGGNLIPTFTWRKNSAPMSGKIFSSLDFASAQLSDEGTYNSSATTMKGAVTSANVTLTVIAPPVVVTPPANVSGNYGTSADFTVTVSGRSPFTYQWQKDGANYGTPTTGSSSTTNTLTVPAEELNEGAYRVVVTNTDGNITSAAATLVANPAPPVIVTAPANQTVAKGSDATFTVTVSGRSPYTYQWQKNDENYGAAIVDSTSTTNSLMVASSDANAGNYRVIVTNADGTTTSTAATLVAEGHPPVLTQQPGFKDIIYNTTTSLHVTVTGRSPFTFQWQKNGVNEGSPVTQAGGTHTLSIPAIATGPSAGTVTRYRCIVTNDDGTTTSDEGLVGMYPSGSFRLQNPEQLLSEGDALIIGSTLLHATAEVSAYAWKKDGKVVDPLPGTAGTLQRSSATLADAGTYTCAATTTLGPATSNSAFVGVVEKAPRTISAALTKPMTLTARAAGPGQTFRWHKGTTPLANGGRISGADKASLVITGVTTGDASAYHCVVTAYGKTRSTGDITVVLETDKPVVNPMTITNVRVGRAFSARITATRTPNSFTAAPLPAGLVLNAATGDITGTPTTAGTTQVKITATNGFGTSTTITVPIVVDRLFDSMTGSFTGLVGTNAGTMALTVLPTGVYTGKTVLGNGTSTLTTISYTGTLKEDPSTGKYTSKSAPLPMPATLYQGGPTYLSLEWSPSDGIFTASLIDFSSDVIQDDISLFKNTWVAATRPATRFAGYFTSFIELERFQNNAAGYGGTGYASFTISSTGTFTLAGKLQDGTAIAIPAFVDENGYAPIFAWLHGNKGSLSGVLKFTAGDAPSYYNSSCQDWSSSKVHWTRPGVAGAPFNDECPYVNGFTSQPVKIDGARYLPPNTALLTGPRMLDTQLGTNNIELLISSGIIEYLPDILSVFRNDLAINHQGTLTNAHTILPQAVLPFDAEHPTYTDFKLDSFSFTAATGLFTGKGVFYEWSESGGVRGSLIQTVPLTFQGITVNHFGTEASTTQITAKGVFNNVVTIESEDGSGVAKRFPLVISGGVEVSPYTAP